MSRQYKVQGTVAEQKTISVDSSFFNFIVAITYYTDAYITEGTPTGGTVEILAKVAGAGDNAEFFDSPIDATDPSAYASAGAALQSITISPIGLSGVSNYKATITGTK